MKPEVIIQQGLKSANILLKNAQKRAAELDHLTRRCSTSSASSVMM